MPTLLIRKIDEVTKAKLRIRAAKNHRSVEAEAREILSSAVLEKRETSAIHLVDQIMDLFAPLGGIELDLPKREPLPEPRKFLP